MVIGFDKDLFIQKCNPSSSTYDCTIDFNILADELFQKNKVWWASRDGVLSEAVNEVAKYHGFSTKKEKEFIRCNRFGETQSSRNFASGPLACNCTFMIQLKALSKIAKLMMSAPRTGAEPKPKWRYTNTWTAPVMIIGKCCEHSGGCTPSELNRLVDGMQRSGKKYVTTISSHPLYIMQPLWHQRRHILEFYQVRPRTNLTKFQKYHHSW